MRNKSRHSFDHVTDDHSLRRILLPLGYLVQLRDICTQYDGWVPLIYIHSYGTALIYCGPLDPEDKCYLFLRNVGNYLQIEKA